MKATILTSWIGSGTETDPFEPQVKNDHQLIRWQDVTGQPAQNIKPDPNLNLVEIKCTPAVLQAIEADPTYLVIWSE